MIEAKLDYMDAKIINESCALDLHQHKDEETECLVYLYEFVKKRVELFDEEEHGKIANTRFLGSTVGG